MWFHQSDKRPLQYWRLQKYAVEVEILKTIICIHNYISQNRETDVLLPMILFNRYDFPVPALPVKKILKPIFIVSMTFFCIAVNTTGFDGTKLTGSFLATGFRLSFILLCNKKQLKSRFKLSSLYLQEQIFFVVCSNFLTLSFWCKEITVFLSLFCTRFIHSVDVFHGQRGNVLIRWSCF